jgi:hypothetical protein
MNAQVKTYVNGALYALLSEPVIREQAKALGVEDMLTIYKEAADEVLLTQLNFVLEQLNAGANPSITRR